MPAEFTKSDVERVATLARLRLTEQEKSLFARQLGTILDYAAQVQDVDTAGVTATPHVLAEPVDRADHVRPSLTETQALANAPEPAIAEGLFKVPRVLGG